MATAAKKTELAAPKQTAMAAAAMYEEDAGQGFEGADAAAYAIPFLSILQSGSPQCKKSDGGYIKGAEEGMFFNSVTQDVISGEEGVTVIPCYYKRSYVQWAPDRGYRGEHSVSDVEGKQIPGMVTVGNHILCGVPAGVTQLLDEKGKPMYDELVDTRTHYILVLDANGSYQPAVVSMSSTQIKKSRQWMSKMNGLKMQRADGSLFTPAMFSHMYQLTTIPESNDQGSWFGWKIATGEKVTDTGLYQAAKEFRAAVSSGEVKEQVPQASPADDVDF